MYVQSFVFSKKTEKRKALEKLAKSGANVSDFPNWIISLFSVFLICMYTYIFPSFLSSFGQGDQIFWWKNRPKSKPDPDFVNFNVLLFMWILCYRQFCNNNYPRLKKMPNWPKFAQSGHPALGVICIFLSFFAHFLLILPQFSLFSFICFSPPLKLSVSVCTSPPFASCVRLNV
jgi:hypothetical protein